MFRVVITIVVLMVLVVSCACAQFDPAVYAAAHQMSIIQGPSTVQAGRGGAGVALNEPWGGNPAAMQITPGTAVQWHNYSFDNGLDAQLVSAKANYPTGRWNFVLNWAELNSTKGSLPIPGLSLDMHESDLSLQIGYKVTENFYFGFGGAPVMDVDMNITSPLGEVAKVSSKPSAGFRLGGLWNLGSGWSAGGFYDNYLEVVHLEVTGVGDSRSSYRSEVGRYGIAYHGGPWTLATDHIKGHLYGAPSEAHVDNWLYGADYKLSRAWTVRAGLFNDQPTGGLSYSDGQTTINYAYMRNVSDDELHAVLGSSSTHALTFSYTF